MITDFADFSPEVGRKSSILVAVAAAPRVAVPRARYARSPRFSPS
jgi:hypothetical protein